MKKVLSFVLVLAMILGCTSMAFAVTETGKDVTKTNTAVPFADAEASKVATILRDLGILKGTDKGAEFDKTITRAEVITTIVRALGYNDLAPVDTKFADTTAAHWASGYIAKAAALGLADGTSATTFSPDDTVSGNEVIAFVLKALGYTQNHLTGTWPDNYLDIANEIGLLTASTKATANKVNREYTFTVLYNALEKHLVTWKEATILEEAHWDVKYKAYVNDTVVGRTLLAQIVADNAVTGVAVLYGAQGNDTVSSETTYANGWSDKNFVGKNVTYLTNNGSKIGIAKVNSKTLEGKFEDGSYATFAGLTVSPAATIASLVAIKNGKVITPVTADLTSKQAITAEVAYDADGRIATMYSISYEKLDATILVTSKAAADFAKLATKVAVTGSDNISFAALKTGELDTTKVKLVGVDSLAEIKENAVIEVYYYGGAVDNGVYKLVVTQNEVLGSISKKEVVKGKDYYTVNGKAYEVAAAASNGAIDIDKFASEYALHLDSTGKVVDFQLYKEKAAKLDWNYAFVLDTTAGAVSSESGWNFTSSSASDMKYQIKLLGFGETEVKVYEVTAAGCKATDESLGIGALPQLIKYQIKNDVIQTMVALGTPDGSSVTVSALGIDKARFAADAKIVAYTLKSGDKALYPTQAAFYTAKNASDIADKAYQVLVITDSAAHIEYLVVSGGAAAAGNTTYATLAAIVGSKIEDKVTYTSILVDGVKSEVKSDAYYEYKEATYTDLYNMTFTGGKLTAADKVTVDSSQIIATEEAVKAKLVDNHISTASFNFGLDDTVIVLTWSKDDKCYVKASADVVAEMANAKEYVWYFDKDSDTFADLIVIK